MVILAYPQKSVISMGFWVALWKIGGRIGALSSSHRNPEMAKLFADTVIVGDRVLYHTGLYPNKFGYIHEITRQKWVVVVFPTQEEPVMFNPRGRVRFTTGDGLWFTGQLQKAA